MDRSVHPWLEEPSHQQVVLIEKIEEATSRLFTTRDTSQRNQQMLVDYLAGLPQTVPPPIQCQEVISPTARTGSSKCASASVARLGVTRQMCTAALPPKCVVIRTP